MQCKDFAPTATRFLSLAMLAAIAGCSTSITASPNPVSAGQPVRLSISVNGVGNGNQNRKHAKLTQSPAGAIADLPNHAVLEYSNSGYGGGNYSGYVDVTAPSTPGTVTITATTKDQGNDPYLTASTDLVVE